MHKEKNIFSNVEDIVSYSIRNANYERVISVIEKFLKERYRNACTCPRCVSDMAALALNFLPPHYCTENHNEAGSPWVMVETAVAEAIDLVMKKPNHRRPNQ